MTWLVSKINKRVQVGKPTQIANDEGGFDFGFDVLLTLWMGMNPVSYKGAGLTYIRGAQINENITHKFTVRRLAIASLGRTYGKGFSGSFDSIADLGLLKSDYYLFLQQGSTVKGRLFRIHEILNKNERNEYLEIGAEEIEEKGTGYPV